MNIVFAIFTFCVALTSGDILFPKDTSTDFLFPPKLRASNVPGMGIGHLRPLGKLKIKVINWDIVQSLLICNFITF